MCFADTHDTHWHILLLENALPTDSLVTLTCAIEYTATDPTPSYFDFVPEAATRRLSLAYKTNDLHGTMPCKCEAWDDKAKAKGRKSRQIDPTMLKEYKGKTTSYDDGPLYDSLVTQFRVPNAKDDRRYRLTWG